MKYCLFCFILLAIRTMYAASASWTGLTVSRLPMDDILGYEISGQVSSDNGKSSLVYGRLYAYSEGESYGLRTEDYRGTLAPVTTQWFLAFYGDVVCNDKIGDLARLKPYFYEYEIEGSTLISDKQDFYLAFTTEEYGVVDPMVWYGWVHLSVDEVGMMSVLSSGIGLNGESVAVGQLIPEPSGGLLFILGAAALGLRRRRVSPPCRFGGGSFPSRRRVCT